MRARLEGAVMALDVVGADDPETAEFGIFDLP